VVKYKDQLSGVELHVNQIQDEGDIITAIVWLQKISIPSPSRVIGNSEEGGLNLNWNFQRSGEFKPKKPSMGGVWIFSGTTH